MENLSYSNEVWRDIKGLEGYYLVSNLGRVRSISRKWSRRDTILKMTNKNGYREISLGRKGERKRCYQVHRLVADAFCEKPDGCNEIDHINGIRDDNRPENLRWVTHKQNMNNPLTKVVISKSTVGRSLSEETKRKLRVQRQNVAVAQLDEDGNIIAEFFSFNEAERRTGICAANINRTTIGRTKRAGGCRWKRIIKIDTVL